MRLSYRDGKTLVLDFVDGEIDIVRTGWNEWQVDGKKAYWRYKFFCKTAVDVVIMLDNIAHFNFDEVVTLQSILYRMDISDE